MSDQDTKLTYKQRAFVRHYVKLGGTNATSAALAAGYAASPSEKGGRAPGASVTASRLLNNPAILRAIRDETERSLRAGVALGANVLEQLCREANSESVRLQAAQALLDRGGLQLANLSQHNIVIEDKRTEGELLARVKELQRELGLQAIDITPAGLTPATKKRAALTQAASTDTTSYSVPGSETISAAHPDPVAIIEVTADEA
jgi:phage terminase small subunit